MEAAAGVLVAIGFSTTAAAAVVTGVVVGAVVGAATAVLNGGNILKGALTGALIGGVTAGVFSAASAALAPTVSAPATTGVDVAMSSATDTMLSGGGFTLAAEAPTVGPTVASSTAGSTAATTAPVVAEKGLLARAGESVFGSGAPTAASEGTSKIIGGIGEGLFKGAGNYLSAKDTAEANRELAEFHKATDLANKAGNIPGQFDAQVIKIGAADWWNQRIDPSKINAPLAGGVANA